MALQLFASLNRQYILHHCVQATVPRANSLLEKSWLGLAFTLLAGVEGLGTAAYRDPVGIPTICFGYTRGVETGDATAEPECQALLLSELV